jgi:hypothetical protein
MTDAQLLVLYNEALQAIATGQSYRIGTRNLSRADLKDVRETIEWLDRRINAASDKVGGLGVIKFEEQL